MFRRVFVVHDHILPPWWVKMAVVTASYSAVLGPYFATKRPFYVATGRFNMASITGHRRSAVFTSRRCRIITVSLDVQTVLPCRILIVYGRLWIVPFDLGNVTIVYGENDRNSGVMCMTVYGVVLLVLGSRFRSKIFH